MKTRLALHAAQEPHDAISAPITNHWNSLVPAYEHQQMWSVQSLFNLVLNKTVITYCAMIAVYFLWGGHGSHIAHWGQQRKHYRWSGYPYWMNQRRIYIGIWWVAKPCGGGIVTKVVELSRRVTDDKFKRKAFTETFATIAYCTFAQEFGHLSLIINVIYQFCTHLNRLDN